MLDCPILLCGVQGLERWSLVQGHGAKIQTQVGLAKDPCFPIAEKVWKFLLDYDKRKWLVWYVSAKSYVEYKFSWNEQKMSKWILMELAVKCVPNG